MADIKKVEVNKPSTPIKDGFALHGKDIAIAYMGCLLEIDDDRQEHGYVAITRPIPFLGHPEAYIDRGNVTVIGEGEGHQYLITTNADGSVKSCTQVR